MFDPLGLVPVSCVIALMEDLISAAMCCQRKLG
jgi:hypothetical protein